MATPILLPETETAGRAHLPAAPDFGWQVIGVLGVVFTLLGLLDIGLAWYPTMFGNPDWEFGTIGTTFNALPVPLLGLALMLGSSVARGWRFGVRLWAGLFFVLALVMVGLFAIYALTLPLAFRSVQDVTARSGLKRSVLKTVVQAVLYIGAFVVMAARGWAHVRRTQQIKRPAAQ